MSEIFNINIVLTRKKKDSEFDDISKVKSEIISWLEDLDFNVEFGVAPNNLLQDAKAIITDEDIEEVMNSDNSKEFDVGYYKGLLDYESKCQSIIWEYISEKDIPEIASRLDNEAKT
tara:strand:- start:296 stop:646 length:351 start_codon:yes stop_codon:yes gene_type:complete